MELGFDLIGDSACTSPAVVTIALPAAVNSVEFARGMAESGFLLSCHSEYLRRRNWIQICAMGECNREKVVSLLNAMQRSAHRQGGVLKAPKAGAEAMVPLS